ncbi:FAD binding domain-containing protein [Geranomyces variabilis]|nr:FAD binding domain-containing protein [Geranomyces variabilis]KAJ3135822.1 hypothetical protein HDU90_003561 [Geranomyces variabilis]
MMSVVTTSQQPLPPSAAAARTRKEKRPTTTTTTTAATVSSSAAAAANIALATTCASSTATTLHNWSGINPIAHRSQIKRPRTEAQLATLVRNATGPVCSIGSALSYEKIASIPLDDPSAVLIDLSQMERSIGLLNYDSSSHLATFGPATTVDSVIRILGDDLGRMLPCSPGVIGIQTLAGSISTGTHGQGLFQSSYADIVHSLRVVLPNGTIVVVGHGPQGRDDLPLDAFVTSMGTLGVITEITIRTAPRRVFHCTKITTDLPALLANYDAWNSSVEFVKVWWFPETDQVHVWLTDEADPAASATRDFLASDRSKPLEAAVASAALNDTVNMYCTAMSLDTKADATATTPPQIAAASHTASAASASAASASASAAAARAALALLSSSSERVPAPQFRTVRRFADARDTTGYQEQILTKGIPVPQVNCELAVPLSQWAAATLALRAWARANPGALHYPFIYRATGASSAWLAPAHNTPVVYIGLLVYLAADGTIRADGLKTMRDVQHVLAPFGALPHWGKHFVPECYDFAARYAKWDEFGSLRRRLDPRNRFLSSWLARVLEPSGVVQQQEEAEEAEESSSSSALVLTKVPPPTLRSPLSSSSVMRNILPPAQIAARL